MKAFPDAERKGSLAHLNEKMKGKMEMLTLNGWTLSFPEDLPYDTRTKQPNDDPLTTLIIVDACETCPWFWHEKCANRVGSHF